MYEKEGPLKIVEMFKYEYKEIKSVNAVKKQKASLSKYGIWNDEEPKLDLTEEFIKKTSKEEIEKIGIRQWSRNNSGKFDISADELRRRFTLMAKYDII
mgnify:FL=1